MGSQTGAGKIPWSSKWQPTPVFLFGKFPGQRSLVDYCPWGHNELDMTDHTIMNVSCCFTAIDVPIDLRWVSQGISGLL